MSTLSVIPFFLLGLLFGSFFNVVGLRLPQNQSFGNDRSACPQCKHTLSWFELVPILSFLLQRGKCRHCKANISYIYPTIELFTGLLFAYSFLHIGFEFELMIALLLVSMLMILLITDINYMLIPNKVLLFFLPPFIILRLIQPLEPWWSAFVGSLVGFGIIAIIIVISRGGMGAGDMKLFGVLGLVLGIDKILLTFFLACMSGAIIGVGLLAFKLIERKQPVPFGPYIIVAALIAYFHSESIITWYVNLF